VEHWLQARLAPSEVEQNVVSKLQSGLLRSIDSWNEDELKFKFVAPLISLIGFNTDSF
jgi:hypothetical protein